MTDNETTDIPEVSTNEEVAQAAGDWKATVCLCVTLLSSILAYLHAFGALVPLVEIVYHYGRFIIGLALLIAITSAAIRAGYGPHLLFLCCAAFIGFGWHMVVKKSELPSIPVVLLTVAITSIAVCIGMHSQKGRKLGNFSFAFILVHLLTLLLTTAVLGTISAIKEEARLAAKSENVLEVQRAQRDAARRAIADEVLRDQNRLRDQLTREKQ